MFLGRPDVITMQWKINQLIFCEQKQALIVDGQAVKLESIASQVLHYLCVNQNEIVSRDELIEHVWQGQLVTDNAVNRVIARLRKALNDDAKNSQYIATVPKKGYRLIASAVSLESQAEMTESVASNNTESLRGMDTYSDTRSTSKVASKMWWGAFFTLCMGVVLWGSLQAVLPVSQLPVSASTKVVSLTRDKGAELDAALSPDQNWLVFSRFENKVLNMYLVDVLNNQQRLISDGSGNTGGAAWSADGSKLVYLYTNHQRCQYRMREFKGGQFVSDNLVYNCPLGSYGKVAFNHAGDGLIFSQRSELNTPYYLYQLDFQRKQVRRLAQPEAHLAGHSQFDLHPANNTLLVSTPDEQQRMSFYELDLENGEFKKLFSKQGFLCCGIWAHDGQSIVMMGPYPATQLERYNLQGELKNTLLHSAQTLGPPRRVANGKDYLFSGGYQNIGLHLIKDDGSRQALTDANVEESLPTFSDDDQYLAYVSNLSGQEQVWIRNFADNKNLRVSQFDDNQKYFDLRWSPDRSHIALLTMEGIRLLNISSGGFRDVSIAESEIRGMSWATVNVLSFSLKGMDGWRVHHYDLRSNRLIKLDEPWRFARYYPAEDVQLVFRDDGTFTLNEQIIDADISAPVGRDRRFAFEWAGDKLYYQHRQDGQTNLSVLDLRSMRSNTLISHQLLFSFTIFSGGTIVSVLDNAELDVLRTLHP